MIWRFKLTLESYFTMFANTGSTKCLLYVFCVTHLAQYLNVIKMFLLINK